MKKIRIAMTFVLLSHFSMGQTNGVKIINRSIYKFPTWEVGINGSDLQKCDTQENYERTISDVHFKMEKITYASDGIEVKAYLYAPVKVEGKMPTIVFNRGSFVRGDIAPELVSMFHRLASQGFIVIAPMYRGSDGASGVDQMGGADLNDLMNINGVLAQLAEVDNQKLFLYGESRGGMMVYQAIRNGFPAKAAAVFAAFTDLESFINSNPQANLQMAKSVWPNFEQEKESIMITRSAVKWTSDIKIPILIMHGGGDRTVDPTQALNLAIKLQELKKEYSIIFYAKDNHRISRNQKDRDERAIEWFKGH